METCERCGGVCSPGNSVREMGERMKGGAVREERSPEKEAILDRAWKAKVSEMR